MSKQCSTGCKWGPNISVSDTAAICTLCGRVGELTRFGNILVSNETSPDNRRVMKNDLFKTMNEDGDLFYDTDSVDQFVIDAESVEIELRKEVEEWVSMYQMVERRARDFEVTNMVLLQDVKKLELVLLRLQQYHSKNSHPSSCGAVNKYFGYVCQLVKGHSHIHSCEVTPYDSENLEYFWPNTQQLGEK